MKVTKNITIDLNNPRRHTVHLMQSGNQREILLTLLKDGMPFDVSEGIGTATLVKGVGYIKANGVPGYYDWTSTDEAAVALVTDTTNKWTVRLDEHATDVPGFAQIFVKFSLASGETLYAFPITLDVIRTSGGSTDPDKPYYHSTSFLLAGAQAEKTASMTSPVGVDPNGKLWADTLLTGEAKDILLDILTHCMFNDDDGPARIALLENAMSVKLLSITATYTQSGLVYYTDTLESLRSDLVVKAAYDDGSETEVESYTLSGTLAIGETCTITVSYGGKTTTFDVDVTNILYILTADDFMRKASMRYEYPYYNTAASNSPARMGYMPFDLLVDGGQTLKFTATSTKDTAQMAALFYNQTALTAVGSQNAIQAADTQDTTWQNLTFTWNVPASINNSPTKCVRIQFRQSTANQTLTDDFIISQVVIEKVME